jgi:hypothetical protein
MKSNAWRRIAAALLAGATIACREPAPPAADTPPTPAPDRAAGAPGTFRHDVAFLEQHTDVILLTSEDQRAQVAVAPAYQGRVMTSTASGPDGASYGYIHRPVIEQGQPQPHMTVVGGEDRFWLGPEGGQYALYFPPGSAFDTEHWQVPAPIDWGGWPVAKATPREVVFSKAMSLTNYAGFTFELRVDRTIRLLDRAALTRHLGRDPGDVDIVGYESENVITNTGGAAWRPESGLVSIWILGMLRPGPRTTVVFPYHAGPEAKLGPIVNDAYFGAQPPERLRVGKTAVFFRGDGTHRGKIGMSRARVRSAAGSYDPDRRLLTIIQFSLPEAPHGYVNSIWARQAEPFGGDVINSYNDGPLGPGQPPLGPFYELESSSPAAALEPGSSLRHVHRTMHLQGGATGLDAIARPVLGVSLEEIAGSLP